MSVSAPSVIAAFDLDGTLTSRDTMLDFLRLTLGRVAVVKGLLAQTPALVRFRLGLLSADEAKEALFSQYFRGWSQEHFERRCTHYAATRLVRLLKEEALERCRWHAAQGHCLVCVSASIRNWIAPWALQNGFSRVIATEVEVQGEILTGRFRGRNCNGPEKVRRFLACFPDRERYRLFAYGDSSGDRELLALADHPFYRRFR